MNYSTKLLFSLATLLAIVSVTQGIWIKETLVKPYDRRTIVVTPTCDSLTITATRASFLRMKRVDIIQWQLNPFGSSWLFGPDHRLNYYERAGLMTSQFSFRAIFRALVEFYDSNGDGAYDEGDQIFQQVPLWGGPPRQCLTYTSTPLNASDPESVVWTVTEQILLPGNGYINISKDFTTDDAFNTNNNITLTPNTGKIDLTIVNFPYLNTSSALALKTFISARGRTRDAQTDYDPSNPTTPVNKPGFVITGDSLVRHGFFTWESSVTHGNVSGEIFQLKISKTLTADNITVDVDKGETVGMVFFTLATSPVNYIYWDPYVGVDEGSPTVPTYGIALIVVAGVIVIVAVVIALVFYLRRKSYVTVEDK